MTRKELEEKAIEMIKGDMQHIGVSDDELLAELENVSDDDLLSFIEE